MKTFGTTVQVMKDASEPVADSAWRATECSRDLAGKGRDPGAWCGKVSVHANKRDDDGTGFVSLELHALSCEQAEAILKLLSQGGDHDR